MKFTLEEWKALMRLLWNELPRRTAEGIFVAVEDVPEPHRSALLRHLGPIERIGFAEWEDWLTRHYLQTLPKRW